MEESDKKILETEVAAPIGRIISQWLKKNGVEGPVTVSASVLKPTCYITDEGVTRYGHVVLVNANIVEFDDDDDEDDDF